MADGGQGEHVDIKTGVGGAGTPSIGEAWCEIRDHLEIEKGTIKSAYRTSHRNFDSVTASCLAATTLIFTVFSLSCVTPLIEEHGALHRTMLK